MATILVIENTESLRKLYAQELQRDGNTVLTVENATQGIALMEVESVDLVVLDVRLPGMDGIEALYLIREAYPGIPVILNSGYGKPFDGVMAEVCLVKSSDIGELRAKIVELLPAHSRHRPFQ